MEANKLTADLRCHGYDFGNQDGTMGGLSEERRDVQSVEVSISTYGGRPKVVCPHHETGTCRRFGKHKNLDIYPPCAVQVMFGEKLMRVLSDMRQKLSRY